MPLSAAEKKRRSRARKPSDYHDREREASRKRMAISRARIRAQKRASELKSILNEADKKTLDALAYKEKQRLICDWFQRNCEGFEPKVVTDDKILNSFMTKRDLYAIETQVAEFEISMLRVGCDDGDTFSWRGSVGVPSARPFDSGLTSLAVAGMGTLQRERYDEKITTKSDKMKIDSSGKNLYNQINRFSEKETATSVTHGNDAPEIFGVGQEGITKLAYSGKSGNGVSSERKEDEVLAAEAMAIMQGMKRT